MGPPETKPRPSKSSTASKASPTGEESGYHYIIIGAGASGCVLASVLANAHPDRRIALLDLGPPDVTREVAGGATGDAMTTGEAKVGTRKRPRLCVYTRFHRVINHRIHPSSHHVYLWRHTLAWGRYTRMSCPILGRLKGRASHGTPIRSAPLRCVLIGVPPQLDVVWVLVPPLLCRAVVAG